MEVRGGRNERERGKDGPNREEGERGRKKERERARERKRERGGWRQG